jgi:hypothetical protein
MISLKINISRILNHLFKNILRQNLISLQLMMYLVKNDQIMIKTSKCEYIYEKNVYDFDLVQVRKKPKKKQQKMHMKIKINGRIETKK